MAGHEADKINGTARQYPFHYPYDEETFAKLTTKTQPSSH